MTYSQEKVIVECVHNYIAIKSQTLSHLQKNISGKPSVTFLHYKVQSSRKEQ